MQGLKEAQTKMSEQQQPEEAERNGIEAYLLPRANVSAAIASQVSKQEMLFSKEAKDLLAIAATLFISHVTALALASDSMKQKKTLKPEALLAGLKKTGFALPEEQLSKQSE